MVGISKLYIAMCVFFMEPHLVFKRVLETVLRAVCVYKATFIDR